MTELFGWVDDDQLIGNISITELEYPISLTPFSLVICSALDLYDYFDTLKKTLVEKYNVSEIFDLSIYFTAMQDLSRNPRLPIVYSPHKNCIDFWRTRNQHQHRTYKNLCPSHEDEHTFLL